MLDLLYCWKGHFGKKSDGVRFESSSFMLYEVSIEEKQCPLIWEVWDIHNKVQVFIFEDYMFRLWLLTLSLPWSSWILWASINICLVFCICLDFYSSCVLGLCHYCTFYKWIFYVNWEFLYFLSSSYASN